MERNVFIVATSLGCLLIKFENKKDMYDKILFLWIALHVEHIPLVQSGVFETDM